MARRRQPQPQPRRISNHTHHRRRTMKIPTQATMTSRLIVIAATATATAAFLVGCCIFSATPGNSLTPPLGTSRIVGRTNHGCNPTLPSLPAGTSGRRTERSRRTNVTPFLPTTTTPTPTRRQFSVEDVVEQLASTEVESLKQELYDLASRTNRGFTANAVERKTASEIIFDLARFNTSREPAQDYYNDGRGGGGGGGGSNTPSNSVKGKWQLIYTDAPDIVSLDSSKNPFSTAKLGRIGQECNPPYIKNIIEWLRPDWAKSLPFSGTDDSRVLQKVVTAASATPTKPMTVDLKVAGFELGAGSDYDGGADQHDHHQIDDYQTIAKANDDWMSRIQKDGLPAGLLSLNPVDLKGPMNPLPFGQFEILYLDEELRMIRTGQNYLAVNRRLRPEEEWF